MQLVNDAMESFCRSINIKLIKNQKQFWSLLYLPEAGRNAIGVDRQGVTCGKWG